MDDYTYSVLSDDVGGLGFCVTFFFICCFCGGVQHLKQLFYSLLQQPVNQNLQHRQLKKSSFLKKGSSQNAVTKNCHFHWRDQSSPVCHMPQTSLQCPRKEGKQIVASVKQKWEIFLNVLPSSQRIFQELQDHPKEH